MRRMAVALAALSLGVLTALAAAGALDPSFGSGGTYTLSQPQNQSFNDLAVAGDGDRYAVGFTDTASNGRDVLVVKLTDAGALDITFNPGGAVPGTLTVTIGAGATNDVAAEVVLQNGVLTITGTTGTDAFVLRLGENGAPTSFSTDGLETLTGFSSANALAIDPDTGDILVAGVNGDTDAGFRVERIDETTGALIGTAMIINITPGVFGPDVPQAIAVLPSDDSIVVGGNAGQSTGSDDFAFARVSAAGVPVNAFGGANNGIAQFGGAGSQNVADLAIDANELIAFSGAQGAGVGQIDGVVGRITSTGGVPDTTFSGDGFVTVPFTAQDGTRFGNFSAITAFNGFVYVTGSAFGCGSAGCASTVVGRFSGAGEPDTAVGPSGVRTFDLAPGRNDFATDVEPGPGADDLAVTASGFNGTDEDGLVALFDTDFPPIDDGTTTTDTDQTTLGLTTTATTTTTTPPALVTPLLTTETPPPPVPFTFSDRRNPLRACDARPFRRTTRRLERTIRSAGPRGRAAAGPSNEAFQGKCKLPPRRNCPGAIGVERIGSLQADALTGTARSDTVRGLEGDDTLRGGDDNDVIIPGPGRDRLVLGEQCDDVIFDGGSGGDETWDGGGGDDVLNGKAATMRGGLGNDHLFNGLQRATTEGNDGDDLISVAGSDGAKVRGGTGADDIDARNQSKDDVDCGAGKDVARVDGGDVRDVVRGCEKVIRG